MNAQTSRRKFLKRAALAGGVVAASPIWNFNILRAAEERKALNYVQIGCGVRSGDHFKETAQRLKQNPIALVDPDDNKLVQTKRVLQRYGLDADKIQTFSDYRVMFDKIGKTVDAVFVTAPNHHHATAAMMALNLDRNVYCEKPVAHTIAEARAMRKMAAEKAKKNVATQMGNQGHCDEGYRLLCEYIWSGLIGKVTETHSWTDRANGGEGPRPPTLPVPAGLHWDEWIGPAPYREYHTDLHPHEWHGWYDFGNGSIGNMGCHVLDGVFWALKCGDPTSVEMEWGRGGSDERYPVGSRIRWDVPAREGMEPFKAYWYEGFNAEAKVKGTAAVGTARNYPQLYWDLKKKYPDDYYGTDSGTLYVGEKGILFTATYGGKPHLIPIESMSNVAKPPQVLPRPKSIFEDFLDACREGRSNTSASFEYGTRLTEFSILANLAQKAGPNKKVEWDGTNMKVTNIPELNALVKRESRQGWGLGAAA